MDIQSIARKRINDTSNPLPDEVKKKILEARQIILNDERNEWIASNTLKNSSDAPNQISQSKKFNDKLIKIYPFPDGFLVRESVGKWLFDKQKLDRIRGENWKQTEEEEIKERQQITSLIITICSSLKL